LVALLGCGAVYWPPPKQTAKPEPSLRSQLESAPQPYNLPHVEILQYQGQRLDEVAKEPENSIKGPQHIDVNTYRLKVGGLVRTPLSLTYQDVIHMPAYQKVTTLNCVEGWSVRYLWQGVLLSDILDRAGADPNAKVIIFRCYDGYSTSLSADYIRSNKILLAYMMNQIYMPAERGFPFQVVAENQYGYKWAKWVTQIEVSNDVNFRGYWETRGYDNTATLQGAP
jgi:DMSO/TMAO reductase YedYZ molybdopterin-dependent catalytic subunit